MYENYLYRLGNVTGFKAQAPEASAAAYAYPRKRELVLKTEDIRIGFNFFFDLTECRLLQDISKRNTLLGRVQPASSKLLYEMKFFQKIGACAEQLSKGSAIKDEDRRAFIRRVLEIRRIKSNDLPKVLWNATFAGPEFRVLLSTATPPLQRNEEVAVAEIESALAYLTDLASHLHGRAPAISPRDFEQYYFTLQRDKTVGKLLKGLQLSRLSLAKASEILSKTEAANRLCPAGKKTIEADYLRNVFNKFYAGEVQPYVSRLYTATGPLLDALQRLLQAQKITPPPAFQTYHAALLDKANPTGLWQRFKHQLDEHTQAWQAVLKQCDLMPKEPIT